MITATTAHVVLCSVTICGICSLSFIISLYFFFLVLDFIIFACKFLGKVFCLAVSLPFDFLPYIIISSVYIFIETTFCVYTIVFTKMFLLCIYNPSTFITQQLSFAHNTISTHKSQIITRPSFFLYHFLQDQYLAVSLLVAESHRCLALNDLRLAG